MMPELTEVSEGETALRAVERDWNAAAQHSNSAGLVALYTEDALFYGGRPGHAVGHAKVREYFDSYVGTPAAARLALVDQELRKLGEGVYLAQGYAAFDFDLTASGATRTVLRSTWRRKMMLGDPPSFGTFRTTYSAPTSGTELNRHKIN
jgi:ketosteroid isomerase-like protein